MTSRRLVKLLAPATIVALLMTACAGDGKDGSDGASGGDTIRIGVVGAADSQWTVFKEKAAAEGLQVEIVDFSDYQVPNRALADGELDLNQFQHLQFLADFNVNTGSDLQPIGATAVYPLNLYSLEYASVEEIPDGATIAVPNDATNLARALLNLQQAGLIELADGGNSFSTEADVLPGSRVEVVPVDAAQTATNLQGGSVQAAVINNDFVSKAGLTDDDIVYPDDPTGDAIKPYINIFVARAEDKDDADYLKLVEIWHDPEVEAAVTEDSGGLAIFVDTPATELQQILADIEANAPAS
ncbi:MAG: methionine ABC transporter substrate-binding protein [Salana multivorans]|uniref:MetQ/NlpA family ABC transporter substrate-binding protein n=1 Tax=Salana multivorans TaxID=120377 RepID=UPI000966C964|nr:MetQ/NlpA family ABC transporter substrate-binding protein [Salana multivorans]MBN8883121.1 methionine ABC transporter substrate-binding protein [Salana multivorans]OJX93765.1 MAG: methionine ABC transporter substrate-binding protein [Micrococcales bacterium 73-15]